MTLAEWDPVPEGLRCGRYKLTRRIGLGGMAEIFLATMPGPFGFEKELVIKRILPEFAEDARSIRMFAEEAKIGAFAVHNNIAQVFEFSRSRDGHYFIAMEFVNGIDLEQLLRKANDHGHRMPTWLSVHLICEVLEALDFLHGLKDKNGNPRRIVHRDPTPSNILISRGGAVKLGDLGIAQFAGKSRTTLAGQLKGKLPYMSPEQLNREPVDRRSDIFSAAVTLWECLTQRSLFGHKRDLDAVVAICSGERPAPSTIASGIPSELDSCLQKALRADRTLRFARASDFKHQLLMILHQLRPRVEQVDVAKAVESIAHANAALPSEIDTGVEAYPTPGGPVDFDPEDQNTLWDDEDDDELPFDKDVGSLTEIGPTLNGHGGEYWVQDLEGERKIEKHEALYEVCLKKSLEACPYWVSFDKHNWLSAQEFAYLSGHDLIVDQGTRPSNVVFSGDLSSTSVASLFGRIHQERATGTLTVVCHEGQDQWYELWFTAGKLVGVQTNITKMQIPELIIAHEDLSREQVQELIRGAMEARVPIEEVFKRKTGKARNRRDWVPLRLSELFTWTQAPFAFNSDYIEANIQTEDVPSLSSLALLPSLVSNTFNLAHLLSLFGASLNATFAPSDLFDGIIEAMDLAPEAQATCKGFGSGTPLAKCLSTTPAEKKHMLTMAYILRETGALLEAR